MLNLVIDELRFAMDCLFEDDWGYAHHTGQAGELPQRLAPMGSYSNGYVMRYLMHTKISTWM